MTNFEEAEKTREEEIDEIKSQYLIMCSEQYSCEECKYDTRNCTMAFVYDYMKKENQMRNPIEHELKILPQFYNGIVTHRKTFEIRKDDRDYKVGDRLLLREFDGENYTGYQTQRVITYILRDAQEYGLKDGYCILGIQPVGLVLYPTDDDRAIEGGGEK